MVLTEQRKFLISKIIFGIVLTICFFQFPRTIDFHGYIKVAGKCLQEGFVNIPYPVKTAVFGDYFQSPVFTLLLSPFGLLPAIAAKILWAILNACLLILLAKRIIRVPLNPLTTLFFLLVFTHPLSDVFLSGNLNFLLLSLIYFGWENIYLEKKENIVLGAMLLSLAIFAKPFALIFIFWFLLTKKFRELLALIIGTLGWVTFTYALLPSSHFLKWWERWFSAIKIYDQAAHLGSVSYQSPPAALFRFLSLGGVEYAQALRIAQTFALIVMITIFFWAVLLENRKADRTTVTFPILFSLFFLGNSFSWALTVLFIFPLLYHAYKNNIPKVAWAAAITLALIPKALWPDEIWNKIATYNAPALLLMLLCTSAFYRIGCRR